MLVLPHELENGDILLDTMGYVIYRIEYETINHIWVETTNRTRVGLPKSRKVAIKRTGQRVDAIVLNAVKNNPLRKRRSDISSAIVFDLYENKGWSMAKIARHFKCGVRTIKRRLGKE